MRSLRHPAGAVRSEVVERFEMPRSRWALPFLALFAPHGGIVELDDEHCTLRLGVLGNASVPLRLIARASTMEWPWWAGVGVRIGRGVVGFVSKSGTVVVLELSEPIEVHAPLRWSTQRVAVRVADPRQFIVSLAYRRSEPAPDAAAPEGG
jgi:hypothetical protein